MKPQRASLVTAVLAGCAASATLSTPAAAAPQRAACAAAATATSLSMDEAVKMVEKRYHARVVKAETERDNGRTVYQLRLLNEAGRVWTVHVDATNGRID
jgi:uncharacterized membrane protein YkoI